MKGFDMEFNEDNRQTAAQLRRTCSMSGVNQPPAFDDSAPCQQRSDTVQFGFDEPLRWITVRVVAATREGIQSNHRAKHVANMP
jgi:hypothetical protein